MSVLHHLDPQFRSKFTEVTGQEKGDKVKIWKGNGSVRIGLLIFTDGGGRESRGCITKDQ